MAVMVNGQGQDQRLEHAKFSFIFSFIEHSHLPRVWAIVEGTIEGHKSRVVYTKNVPQHHRKKHSLKLRGGKLIGRK